MIFGQLIESVRVEVLGEGLTKSKEDKDKDDDKKKSSSDSDETEAERKERLARERSEFSDKWGEKKQSQATKSEKLQKQYTAKKRHKVLSGALKAISRHTKHAVNSTGSSGSSK